MTSPLHYVGLAKRPAMICANKMDTGEEAAKQLKNLGWRLRVAIKLIVYFCRVWRQNTDLLTWLLMMVGIKCTNRKLVLTRFAPSLQVMGSISRRIDIAVTGGDFQEKIVLSSIRRTWSTGCTVGMRIKMIFFRPTRLRASFLPFSFTTRWCLWKKLKKEAPKTEDKETKA